MNSSRACAPQEVVRGGGGTGGDGGSAGLCRIPDSIPATHEVPMVPGRYASADPGPVASHCPPFEPGATLASDAHPKYPQWGQKHLPGGRHQVHKAFVSKLAQKQKERGPLFAINLAFAKVRNDLTRLARKTWITTKSIKALEQHLWLWVAWANGYDLK